jgi:ABC-type tungstate transport system substrate-binding protein
VADGPLLVAVPVTYENFPTVVFGLFVFLLLAHILYPSREKNN